MRTESLAECRDQVKLWGPRLLPRRKRGRLQARSQCHRQSLGGEVHPCCWTTSARWSRDWWRRTGCASCRPAWAGKRQVDRSWLEGKKGRLACDHRRHVDCNIQDEHLSIGQLPLSSGCVIKPLPSGPLPPLLPQIVAVLVRLHAHTRHGVVLLIGCQPWQKELISREVFRHQQEHRNQKLKESERGGEREEQGGGISRPAEEEVLVDINNEVSWRLDSVGGWIQLRAIWLLC